MSWTRYRRQCVWCGVRFITNRPQAYHCTVDCSQAHMAARQRELRWKKKHPEAFEAATKREKAARCLSWQKIDKRFGATFAEIERAFT